MDRIVIMAENRVGVIADIARALADADVNIETLNTDAARDTGVVILTTDEHDRALSALADAGFRAVTDDSLLIRLPDEPGALARVAERFKLAGVNIQSLHIMNRGGGFTTVALSTHDRAQAVGLVDPEWVV